MMTASAARMVTNNHHKEQHLGFFGFIFDLLRTWIQRSRNRQQLARLSERDLHDVGLSWGDRLYEIEKPFWRE